MSVAKAHIIQGGMRWSNTLPFLLITKAAPPDSTEKDAIISKLLHANPPVTDLWILAYGWNNDEVSGKETYGNTWIPLLWSEIQKMNMLRRPRIVSRATARAVGVICTWNCRS